MSLRSTRSRARTFALPLLVGFGVVAAGASAAPLRFKSLPEVRLAGVPTRAGAPAALDSSERVSGFEGIRTPHEAMPVPVEADTSERGRHPSACFVFAHEGVNEGEPWPTALESALVAQPTRHAVLAARSERLIARRLGRAELEATDAWVDWKTGGARLITRSNVTLARVASGPGGVEVFAARQGKLVHFVVTPSKVPELALPGERSLMKRAKQHLLGRSGHDSQRQMLHSLLRGLVVARPGGEGARAECGHARVTLGVEEGGGETAQVLAELLVETPEKGETAPEDGRLGVKLRALRVQLSVSQTSSDAAPIPTVSFAWSGKARDTF